ncbi:hypothetical protein GN157_00425 [Flavobacterium rakeshii]|uniref:Uncharacterized protein n=1 Tax=Flavobacterium rakeshii TaxID=1038845 RepID=A0A6N8H7A1_9FLAO|nr:hypothetical protein [Flavobacterium rakeshii]MEE1898100.1 hypothetical protein [Flavobacterium rakeshii]MUV02162.1 hypothetical protein [Flavobacterium rakeshii]
MFEYELHLPDSKNYLLRKVKRLIYEYDADFEITISTKDLEVYLVKFKSEIALENFEKDIDNLFLD